MLLLRTRIFLLLVLAIIEIESRPGGRSRGARIRMPSRGLGKYKDNRKLGYGRQSNTRALVRGAAAGGAAFVIGSLALRTFASNNNNNGHRSRNILNQGTGDLCVNKENFSNFIFHEYRCPLQPVFSTNERYCCGPNDQQYCCSFWESGGRAIGAIIGIIAACALFFLFVACCIVYYRRRLKSKTATYVAAAQADDNDTNQRTATPQTSITRRSPEYDQTDAPPPYFEAVRRLNDS